MDNQQKQFSKDKILLELPTGTICVAYNTIVLFEANERQTVVHLEDGSSVLVKKPLSYFLKKLISSPIFYQTHDSYIINLKHLEYFSTNKESYVLVTSNKRVPISLHKIEEFMTIIKAVFYI